MNERRRIEDRIKKKDMEIQELENKLRDARTYIQALQDVLKILPRDGGAPAESASTLRPGSSVARAHHAIREQNKPLHINEILERIGKDDSRKNRAAIAGSISAYVRRNEIFVRTGPNTFGLLELGHSSASAPPPIPPTFGVESDRAEDFGDSEQPELDPSDIDSIDF